MLRLLEQTRIWVIFTLSAVLLVGCAAPPERADDSGPIVFPKPPDEPRYVFERTITGTGAVRALTDQDRLKAILTGAATREGIGFAKPFDVAAWRGRIYVSDTVHRSVMVMDFPGGTSYVIGDRGDDGDLQKPLGIAVDDGGFVYVVDGTRRGVNIYDETGDFVRRLDLSEMADRPSGIAVDPQGTRVYVVDTGGVDSERHRVLVLDGTSGRLIRSIGTRGVRDGEFNLPRDVAVTRQGLVYVTDGGNFRVQAFDAEGRHIQSWGEPGRRLGQFSRPKGISVDKDGNVYVVDAAFGNFQIFNSKGQLLMFVGERSTTPEPAKYMLPAGIAVDEDGRVYMIDQFFRKMDVFRPFEMDESDGWFGAREAGARS